MGRAVAPITAKQFYSKPCCDIMEHEIVLKIAGSGSYIPIHNKFYG